MSRLPPPLAWFRAVALLACLSLALRQGVLLWPLGETGLSHSRERLLLLIGPAWGTEGALAAYALGFAWFAWALWRATAGGERAPDAAHKAALLAAQLALALLLNDKLLLLTALEAALLFSWRAAAAALAAQLVLSLLANGWQARHLPDRELLCNVSGSRVELPPQALRRWQLWQDAALGGGFQLLTFGIGCLGAAQGRRRAELEATRAGLLAARQLLAGAAGNAERLRLARELHDGIGHHLSSLNLQLELMLRRGAGDAEAPLRAAQQAARDMLAEVRALVGRERRQREAPLGAALQLLCAGLGHGLEWQAAADLALSDDAAWRAFAAARHALAQAGGRPRCLRLQGWEDGSVELRMREDNGQEAAGWTTIWREAAR